MSAADSASPRRLRLWPLPVILLIQTVALVLSVTPGINNGTRFGYMMLGPLAALVLFWIWLLFASRMTWKEKGMIFLGFALCGIGAGFLAHPSAYVGVWIYGVPLAILATSLLFFWQQRGPGRKLLTVLLGPLLAFGALDFTRFEGFTGAYLPEIAWRWSSSSEDALAEVGRTDAEWQANAAAWPAFRGAARDSKVGGDNAPLDWNAAPPTERWRLTMGPGWSSFIHVGERLFTQEQRGEGELTTAYDAASGDLLWQSAVDARFNEVVAGPGPRATPSYANGVLVVQGATGILSAMDAASGSLLWQWDLRKEVNAPLPVWGFSGSPLIVGDRVVVYAGGDDPNGLIAYDLVSGRVLWQVATRGMNFSSPQPIRMEGQELILFGGGDGFMTIDPADGEVLWTFKPSEWSGIPIVQAQQVSATDLIVPIGDGAGVARLRATLEGGDWKVEELWSSNRLKPSYNDFLYHQGYLYGFDQNIFTCIDAVTGERQWKRGRYGFGQAVLLEDRGQIIVLSETGEVVLLAANPETHEELGALQVIEGKTWNHPIVVDDVLYVRNGREAVALEL